VNQARYREDTAECNRSWKFAVEFDSVTSTGTGCGKNLGKD